jgi:hypothetical protein
MRSSTDEQGELYQISGKSKEKSAKRLDTDWKILLITENKNRSRVKARDLRYAPACANDAKILAVARRLSLVTRCGKRGKKIYKISRFVAGYLCF